MLTGVHNVFQTDSFRSMSMNDEVKISEVKTANEIASLGGKAAAANMTAAERSERAKQAASARWSKNLPQATHIGELELAGTKIPCAVLEDGRRVLSQQAFVQAIGRTGNLKTAARSEEGGFFDTPPFLTAGNLKPYVDKYLKSASAGPVVYRPTQGTVGYGYEASFLPTVCRVYLDARREKALNKTQQHIAEACEVLLAALANVGIDAMVDEATGFQYDRTRDALQRLLEQYVSRELARWEKTFEIDFYKHMYRLKKWKFNPASSKRTPQAARLTVDLTYDRIHPELLRELKQVRNDKDKPSSKLHQWLTTGPAGGHPRLKQHLEGVVALMSVAENWPQFMEWMDRRYPKCNTTMSIPFHEFEDEDDMPPEVKKS